jgi:hypothetical protein
MPATKRKPPSISIPSLIERATVLLEELLEAPASEQREVLTLWRDKLDAALDHIAEAIRPRGETKVDALGQSAVVGSIPVGFIRTQLDSKGYGNCHCRSMIEAVKES